MSQAKKMYEKVDEEMKKKLETGCEQLLYFVIDGLGGFIWRMEHDLGDGRIESTPGIEKDLLKMRETQQLAVSQLSRVGVEGALDENGRTTDIYWNWYRTWKSYIDGLDNADFYKLDKLSQEGTSPELGYMRPDPKEIDRFNLMDLEE